MPVSAVTRKDRCKCGASIDASTTSGFCAACLFEAALVSPPTDDATSAGANVLMDFGDYELLEEIGRGGQGVVYRARQKALNRTVALKIVGLGHWASEKHLRRFRMEAEAAAQLDHPGIVPIYEIGEREGACFYSMKFVQGGHLDEVLKRETMPSRRSAELIASVARTVHYANEHGVLHRDIKPGNILLDTNGTPLLTDFGLARLVEKESNVTRTMDVLGTPSYMAPEQASGQRGELTSAADVYGLGAVLYHSLTRHPPFAGGTTYETVRMVLQDEPRKPRLWNPKVDRELETICLKCLEKDAARRYSSALELAEDLERWLRHEAVHARRSGPLVRTRKWIRRNTVTAVLVTLLVAAAVALTLTLWQRRAEPPPAAVAVLPFDNLSDEKEDALLADAIQDDVLTKLAKIANLKVISRTSVMAYRGERNIRKIGNALRVSHVLEGSVHRVDGRVRVNAQLIDANSDTHLWAETYERSRADVFALESDLAKEVATRLATKVSHTEKAAIEAKPTSDLEAYELYVRAKPLAQVLTPDEPAGIERTELAIDLLVKAVTRDPNFALAHCLLTEANLSLYWRDDGAETIYRTRAEAALRAAQRVAPQAGETHLAQARFSYYGDRDFDRALEELEIAGRLLPNSAQVLLTTGRLERRLNRWKEALRHFAQANDLDPRDPRYLLQIAETYRFLRHYREAEETADRGLAAFPEAADQFWKQNAEVALDLGEVETARFAVDKISRKQAFPLLLIRLFLDQRDYHEVERVATAQWNDPSGVRFTGLAAVLAARAAGDAENVRSSAVRAHDAHELVLRAPLLDHATALSEIGVLDAALGRRENAIAECRRAVELRPIARDGLEGPECLAHLALAYTWLGERDLALEQLAILAKAPVAVAQGDLKLSPMWDSLRDDPRFQQIIEEAAKPLSL